jgi:hypothetical protein
MREYAGKLVARERVQKPGRDADRSVPAIAAGGAGVGARAIDDIEPRRRYRCALRELVQDSATSCGALPASTSRPPRLFGASSWSFQKLNSLVAAVPTRPMITPSGAPMA